MRARPESLGTGTKLTVSITTAMLFVMDSGLVAPAAI